ncbi:MAG: hypothetical protein RIQ81_166 [Pseudomonadota bacterium]|jgi:proteic killer suppression protein
MAICGFADKLTEDFFYSGIAPHSVGWRFVAQIAARKLDYLDYAATLSDLAAPPGNRLEALYGTLDGFHSIRINRQWRLVFRWTEDGPDQVSLIDYHR